MIGALVFLIYSYSTAHEGEGGVMDGAYRLTAMFDNTGGLKTGDDVRVSGVKVGAIDGIKLDPKLYRAEVTFTVSDTVKLAKDSSAKISSESLLGGRYLEVQPGGDENDLIDGETISMTQSPANLEDLLGRFIFSAAETKKDGAAPADDSAPEPESP